MHRDLEEKLKKIYRVAFLMYGAMAASIFVYGAVLMLILKSLPVTGAEAAPPAILKEVFGVLAVLGLAFSLPLRNFVVASALKKVPRGAAVDYPQLLLSASAAGFAFCEASAIYGLILSVINRDMALFYPFAAGALIGFAFHCPNFSQWQEWVEKAAAEAGTSAQ